MAPKNPLGKIRNVAVETIKDPVGTGQKAVNRAVGLSLGTLGTVTATVSSVTSKVPGRKQSSSTSEDRPKPVAVPDGPRKTHGDPVTPIKTTAKKASAKKAPAKRPAAKKAPAKKSAAKKSPARKTATTQAATTQTATTQPETTQTAPKPAPLTAAELAAGAGTEVITPVGTRGADVATNPDTNITDLQQPGTPPLVDSATAKSVASESEMLRRAADPNPE